MFAELPKLFDRDFAIGYFLPVTIFLAASLALMGSFGVESSLVSDAEKNLLVGTTLFALLAWLLAIVLLGANRTVLRLLEGYCGRKPLSLLRKREEKRYDDLIAQITALDSEYETCAKAGHSYPPDSRKKRADLKRRLAERFPPERRMLLPTAFGNTIRAFETYSWAMYGMDAIPGWSRLLTVIPKDNRELIDEAKAEMDFWVNIWVLAVLVFVEYIGLGLWVHSVVALYLLWVPAIAGVVIFLAKWRARIAAVEWGAQVKAAFDVYLPALRVKLSFPAESDWEKERTVWEDFSRAVTYRDSSSLPSRDVHQLQGDSE